SATGGHRPRRRAPPRRHSNSPSRRWRISRAGSVKGRVMKAARLQSYGDPSMFKLEDAADPAPPGPGEVLVKIAVSGVNHIDLYMRAGQLHQMIPLQHPAILGRDGAGTIAAVGPGVTGFKVGDRVAAMFPLNGRGAHAELAVAPITAVAH